MALKARPVMVATTMLGLTFLLSACHGYYGHHRSYGGHGGYYHGQSYGHGYGHRSHGYRGRGYRYRH